MVENTTEPPTLEPLGDHVECPVCRKPMQLTDVDEVFVDVCSEHGLWLDLGEEKLLLRRAKRHTRSGNHVSMARARRRGYAKGYAETGYLFTPESDRVLHQWLADRRRARLRKALASTRQKTMQSTAKRLLCPLCGKKMQKRFSPDLHGDTPDIVVDLCPEHGMWLDNGELDVLVDRAEDEGRRAAARRVRKSYERGFREGKEAAMFDF